MKYILYPIMLMLLIAGASAIESENFFKSYYNDVFVTLEEGRGCFGVGDITGNGVPELLLVDDATSVIYAYSYGSSGYISLSDVLDKQYDRCRIIIDDYENDGDNDIIIMGVDTVAVNASLDIYLNDGKGVLSLWYEAPAEDGLFFTLDKEYDYGDIDGNGYLDIFAYAYNDSSAADVMVFYGFENGLYLDRDASQYLSIISAGLGLADLDGDYDLDLVYGCLVYENVENVFYYATVLPSCSSNTFTEIADLNRDGRSDIIVSHGGTDTIFYNVTGNFSIAFVNKADFSAISAGASTIGDIEGDGTTEVIFSGRDVIGKLVTYKIYIQEDGLINSTKLANIVSGEQNGHIALFDADSDGDLDLYTMVYQPKYADIEKANKFYLNTLYAPTDLPDNPAVSITGELINVENNTGLLPELVYGMFSFFEGIGVRGYAFIFAIIMVIILAIVLSFIPALIRKISDVTR